MFAASQGLVGKDAEDGPVFDEILQHSFIEKLCVIEIVLHRIFIDKVQPV
jgi:hypothetical protein